MKSNRYPITAIIIFRNEQHLLTDCLEALHFCDEIITVDMSSTDRSATIARRYSDKMFEVEPYPIAEPTRVAAAELAKNDWIFYVDPDEIIPPELAQDIVNTIEQTPNAGIIQIPLRFYFKRQLLTGTVWGTSTHVSKIANRKRADILPLCNRLMDIKPDYETVRIPHNNNHMLHMWSDSYRDLFHKHFIRYPHLEAKAKVARGEKFTLSRGLLEPLHELKICLKDFDGWRMGPRGFALSFIFFIYTIASIWLMLRYQKDTKPNDTQTHGQLPTLREIKLNHQSTNTHERTAA
ncbi:glycosyltransferase family 2 protein [Planctomycetota bacterium]|nr:glycosyltransferase family 2 protein [Planctomycetota bacterium]